LWLRGETLTIFVSNGWRAGIVFGAGEPSCAFGLVRLMVNQTPEMAKATQNFSKSCQVFSTVLMETVVK